MAEQKFALTPDQARAVYTRAHSIMVSAAAGSGKTAVLVQRIVSLLKEPGQGSLRDMMIVTFTKAAAAEMRTRLKKELRNERQNPEYAQIMSNALLELESVQISTIHSFCQRLIMENFEALDVEPRPRICETGVRKQLFEESLHQAISQIYEEQRDENALLLLKNVPLKTVQDWCDRLYTFLMSIGDPFNWLRQKADDLVKEPFREQPWYQFLEMSLSEKLEGIQQQVVDMESSFSDRNAVEKRHNDYLKDVNKINDLIDNIEKRDCDASDLLVNFKFDKATIMRGLPPEQKEWNDDFNSLRKDLAAQLKEQGLRLSLDEDTHRAEIARCRRLVLGLCSVLERTHDLFIEAKRERHSIDYSDMEQLAWKLVHMEDKQEAISSRFRHIFVDECQDVSRIQDDIIQALQGPNCSLFMVGDVKQSIYRFRNADPTLFLDRLMEYRNAGDPERVAISLQQNFRSNPMVLEATNRLFRSVMRKEVTELDYGPEEELNAGRTCSETPRVQVLLTGDTRGEGADERFLRECAAAAEEISRLISTGACTPKDIAILMPKVKTRAEQLSQVLENYGIHAFSDVGISFTETPEISALLQMLRCFCQPNDDIALLTTLKMIPYELTDAELADIRLCADGQKMPFHEAFALCTQEDTPLGKKCGEIQQSIEAWRFRCRHMGVVDFLWKLMEELELIPVSGALPGGTRRQANLRMLIQKAADFEENTGYTMPEFLASVNLESGEDDQTPKTVQPGEEMLHIMTIHKSKGLEFPVVFLLGLEDKLEKNEGSLSMLPDFGVLVPGYYRDQHYYKNSAMRNAMDAKSELNQKAERARLLYVAMTRARDRLFIVGNDGLSNRYWRIKPGAYRIAQASCMWDWIMQVICDEVDLPKSSEDWVDLLPENSPWSIRLVNPDKPPEVDFTQLQLAQTNVCLQFLDLIQHPMRSSLNAMWENLGQDLNQEPLKVSVTSRVHGHQKPKAVDPETFIQEENAYVKESLGQQRDLPRAPRFIEERLPDPALGGTVNHRLLSLFDIQAAALAENKKAFAFDEAARLVESHHFTQEEKGLLKPAMLGGFLEHALFKRMVLAEKIHREWHFTHRLPDGFFLQGVIDLAFREEDGWVVVDYKTDRIKEIEELDAKYRKQLQLYAQAIKEILHEPVKECWLFSLRLKEGIRL